ncbi:MAG TPA: hypothetical protein VNM47_13925, partial [Terriglobia bacterium]|nr:hypothetical protein [Terriglobia bacterium]
MNLRNLKLRKLVRWLIYTAGATLVLLTVIIAVASSAWFRNVLQHRIESGLMHVIGGKVEISGMEFSPLKLRVNIHRLVIHGLEKNPGQPLFSARDVVVNISPQSLLQFRLLLQTLQWQQAELYVQTYPDGSTNLPGATTAPRSGQALAGLLDLEINRLTLSHTTLQWNDQRIPFQVAGHNVAMQLHISQDRHYLGSIASSDAVLDWKGRTSPHLSFATTFNLSEEQIEVPGLSWQIENLRGHLAGAIRWTPQLAGNFEFRTNGGLQEFARALRIAPLESGYLYLDGKGSYDGKGISVKGRIRARDLRLRTREVNPGAVNFTSDYEIAGNQLRVPNFTLTGLKARADGDATAQLGKTPRQVVVRTRFKDLNLRALTQAIPGKKGAIVDLHPEAIIAGTLNAKWQERFGLESQFDLQFNPPEEPELPGLPLSGHAQGSLDLGRKILLTLHDAEISTPQSTMSARGAFGDTRSSLSVRFVTSDFEEWRPVAKVLIETQNPLPVTLHSQMIFTGNISGTFSNPEIEGQVSTGTFNYGGWAWDSFQAGIIVSPQRARIQSGQLKLGKSSLTLNAEAGLYGWKLEPYSAVRLGAAAHESPLAGLRAALDLKPSMQGLISGQVQVEGTVESLSGRGQVAIHDGEFAGVPFDLFSADILATQSNWNIRNFRLVEGQGRADGSMQINPVQRTFSANVHGRNFPLDHIHFLNPKMAESKVNDGVSGLVSFDLQGGGAFYKAQLHLGVDITELAWKGQQLGSVHGDGDWQGRQIKLQIKGGGGEAGNFQMAGSLETRGDWPLQLSGQYSGMRMDPWIEEFSGHSMAAEIS